VGRRVVTLKRFVPINPTHDRSALHVVAGTWQSPATNRWRMSSS